MRVRAASLLVALAFVASCASPTPADSPLPIDQPEPTAVGPASGPPAITPSGAVPPTMEPLPSAAPPGPDLTARPLIWFAPHAETRLPDFMKGSADYFDLFAPNAGWSTAARRVQVFQTCDNLCLAREPTDEEINAVLDGLARRGMAFAMELPPLPHPLAGGRNTECGSPGIEGFGGEFSIQTLERIKSLGGRVDFIAFGEPFAHATLYDGPNACLWSNELVAAEIVEFVRAVREVHPDVIFGDTEPAWNGPFVGAAEIGAWLDAYAAAAGEPLGFFHLDVDWTRAGWQAVAREIEDAVRARGVPFGIIYNGGDGASSDAEWLQLSAERAYEFEQEHGGQPDHVVLQSWHYYPTRVLPDTDPATFTGLINRYFAPRTEMAGGELHLVADAPLVTTTLSIVGGVAVAGAELRGRAMPLDGQQQALRLAGEVPEDADEALVAIRINSEGAGPGTADINLYAVELAFDGGPNRLQNPRFAQRLEGWYPYGEGHATTPASDLGPGRMLRLRAGTDEVLDVNTSNLRVVPGVPYELSVTAAVPLASAGSGYISIIFLGEGEELRRDILPFAPAPIDLEPATTDGSGEAAVRLAGLAAGRYLVEVTYAGDMQHWPARLEREVRIGD
jgi:hypothetical protein